MLNAKVSMRKIETGLFIKQLYNIASALVLPNSY